MRKIDTKVANAVRVSLPRMGEGYASRHVGGNTQVAHGSSLSRRPVLSVKLYDTYVVTATGNPANYILDLDVGWFSATTRARVNASLEALGLGLSVRGRKSEPAYFLHGEELREWRGEYRPSFHVVEGRVLA